MSSPERVDDEFFDFIDGVSSETERLVMGLVYCTILSSIGGVITYYNIERFMPQFEAAGLFGIDLNKSTTRRDKDGNLVRPIQGVKVPEAVGVVSGAVYVVVTCLFLPFTAFKPSTNVRFLELLTGMMCIMLMNFLGFADNVLNLRWRDKLILPAFATLPILLVYYMQSNVTTMMLPFNLGSIYLGPLFYVFLAGIVIFCTNWRLPSGWPLRQQHQMSLYIMLPFIGVTMPLLYYNWFPARVFVGDTFCYFAGMAFAVAAILGHFTKTLMLLLIPQLFNFLYSIPQLFWIVPCPRHRMPSFDPEKKLLINSYAHYPGDFPEDKLPSPAKEKFGRALLKFLHITGLAVVIYEKDGSIKFSNLTLINLALKITGPIREDKLTIVLMTLQAVCALLCYGFRFGVAQLFYEVVW